MWANSLCRESRRRGDGTALNVTALQDTRKQLRRQTARGDLVRYGLSALTPP
jgi:hypothetical protein